MSAAAAPARRASLRLALFTAVLFVPLGVQVPFLPLWFEHRGFDPAAIGLLLGVPLWLRSIATPLIARFVDVHGQRRPTMAVLVVAALASFACFPLAGTLAAMLPLVCLFQVAYASTFPLTDNAIVQNARAGGVRYGRLRAFGSAAFLCLALGSGNLLEGRTPALVHGLMLGGLAAVVLALPLVAESTASAARSSAPLRELFRDRGYLLLIGSVALLQSSHAAYYAFATLHWERAGLGRGTISALWAEAVVAEILLFFAGAGLAKRIGPARLLALCSIAGLLRWCGTGATTSLPGLSALQTLHAFTFGAVHLSTVEWIGRHVAPERSATGQSLMAAAVGMVSAAATALCGVWYERAGGQVFFGMAALAVAGGAGALVLSAVGPGASAAEPRPVREA